MTTTTDSSARGSCFKAYDIRGRVPDELDPALACRLGRAYAERFAPRRVALGRDVRHSSPMLLDGLARGFNDCGVEVLDLGLCGTEEIYWAAQQPGVDGGIIVTASHNPAAYNGMKLVRGGAVPISNDTGLLDLKQRVERAATRPSPAAPRKTPASFRDAYVQYLLGFVDRSRLQPLRIVVNAGNGAVGPLLDALEPHLPLELIRVHAEPDGDFPNGIPNPLLPGMRDDTIAAVREHRADFGVAWDGDFDRCFLFDERGAFIEGYYIVGLLAKMLLGKCSDSHNRPRVVHDPRLVWNTIDIVTRSGGEPVQSKTGHAFIKERMRAENAVYGGEMSAHHYFRDFAYCDNGTLPWLLIAELISVTDTPLSRLVGDRVRMFPVSGEINRRVDDIPATLSAIEKRFAARAVSLDRTDGLGLEFESWRFNVRGSNTEPLLRLNVESRGDPELMLARANELLGLIDRSA